jgi:signal transduction histidine kinase/CheY-like chemotaxis protein
LRVSSETMARQRQTPDRGESETPLPVDGPASEPGEPGSTKRHASSATLDAAREQVLQLEQRLAEAEAMVKALLVGNLDPVIAATRHEGPFRAIVEGALQRGLADRSAVIEQLPCGVVVYDQRGRLLFANPVAAELAGPSRDPRVLPTCSLDLGPADPTTNRPFTAAELPVTRALAGEHVTSFECALRVPSERDEQTLRLSAVPRVDEAGNIIGALCTIIDVTERWRLQRELLQSDRMACVGSLAAGMAHEINNPLAYILANVAFVAEEIPSLVHALQSGDSVALPRTQEIGRALGDAREGAERIRRVVSELKTFARAEDDVRQPLDVRGALEDACHVAETEIRHRARLIKDFAVVPLVLASEARLRQLFLNLLMNALQAVDETKGDVREIRVSTALGQGGEVIIEVRDSGPGIAPALLPRVFDPFFSLRPAGTSAGFGLATCESITLAHGGTIEVESEIGRGTVFRVSLPAEVAIVAVAPGTPPARPSARPRRGRVLVVDDELSVADSIKRILARDHDVTIALRAADALDALARGDEFDLILCDIMMPEIGGLELYAQIAELRPALLSKLAFMTGGAFTSRARAFLESVPNARLHKPFELAELRAFVNARIAQAQAGG